MHRAIIKLRSKLFLALLPVLTSAAAGARPTDPILKMTARAHHMSLCSVVLSIPNAICGKAKERKPTEMLITSRFAFSVVWAEERGAEIRVDGSES